MSKVTANGKIQAERTGRSLRPRHGADREPRRSRTATGSRRDDFLLQIDKNQAAAGEAGSAAALQAALGDRDSARATLEQARRDFERAKKNYRGEHPPGGGFAGREDRASRRRRPTSRAAENRIEQNRANLNASRDTLSKTTVRAPIDGVVTALPSRKARSRSSAR